MDNTMPILLVPGLVVLAPDLCACDPGLVAIRPGDGGQPHPRRQYGRDRAPDPGRGAAALRAGRPFDGRLHRLRDHAAGAGAGRQTGADEHPGAARYAGGDRRAAAARSPARKAGEYRAVLDELFPASCIPRGATMPPCASWCTTWATMSGPRPLSRQQTAIIGPAGLAADAGVDQVSDAGAVRRRGQHHPEFAVDGDGRAAFPARNWSSSPNCGHLPQVEQPQATADALVEWLRS